jgi:hypothetical protein
MAEQPTEALNDGQPEAEPAAIRRSTGALEKLAEDVAL